MLQCATLSGTSASSVFSISKPATLNSASLFLMITSLLLADVDARVGGAERHRVVDQHVVREHGIDRVAAVAAVGDVVARDAVRVDVGARALGEETLVLRT